MNKEIKIEPLAKSKVAEAAKVLLEAFKDEAFTAAWLDLSKSWQRKLYGTAVELKLKNHLEAGQPVFAAVENDRVRGLFVLKLPHVKTPHLTVIRLLLPRLPRLLALAPYFIRAVDLAPAAKAPENLPDSHCVLEGLAVEPGHQGKKIGRMLLEHADKYCSDELNCSGIYLMTGDEKNRQIYERFGYELLETRNSGSLTAYHMFKNIK